ncbi:MAG: hypothetical protein ABSB78_07670 [Bacteroidota bacterium]
MHSITNYLDVAPLDDLLRQKALSENGVFANLCKWMEDLNIDRLSPKAKDGILKAIENNRWADIAEVFYTDIEFGTGGIRGRAVITDEELEMLRDEGVGAPFLRGPNTINDLVFSQISAAIARFGNDRKFKSVVIGYDSRLRGRDFAHLVASVFIYFGYKVLLFDDVVPYPEVTFAIPHLKADIGILISASHNDRRYNGYKLSCSNGSQFSISDRTIILDKYIGTTQFKDISYTPLEKTSDDQLLFLGGGYKYPHLEYYSFRGLPKDVHKEHFSHVLEFVLEKKEIRELTDQIHLAYSAYNGAGGPTVKRLVEALGIIKFDVIASMYKVDGMFPAFEDLRSPKGYKVYQQPDPGEPRAAEVALKKYVQEYGEKRLQKVDLLIGTDPDADRTGITVKVPNEFRKIVGNHEFLLLDADTAWSLILWYRLENWQKITGLKMMGLSIENCFIAQSHTTTDVMPFLAKKYGLGCVKTWVGFAQLATAVEKVWTGTLYEDYFIPSNRTEDFRSIFGFENISSKSIYNFAALEQSNGFSILGGRPKSQYDLGEYGHVRDKDGTFAAILFLDLLTYSKRIGKSILDIVNEKLYLDPNIGLIRTGYRAAPQYGQYEGLEGRSLKLDIIRNVLHLVDDVTEKGVTIGKRNVTRYEIYKTGKYDIQHGHTADRGFDYSKRETYWFPDEGIRFYFEDNYNHLTVRPSGTSQSLRFHVQLRNGDVNKYNINKKRKKLEIEIQTIFDEIGDRLGVDWEI